MPGTDSSTILAVAAPLALAAAGLAALASGFRPLRGTTLRAPWWWTITSLCVIALSESTIALFHAGETAGAAQLRLAAAASSFCPLVALLGAKRPQDGAWQFIVLSFWAILALPAAQAWLLRPGEALAVHPIWSWFLVILTIVGCTNFLPTRFWLAGLLAAAGQTMLNWPYLPFASGTRFGFTPVGGSGLLSAALVAAALIGRRPRRAGEPLDRLWTDFRDHYGAVWGLRVAERVNASAKLYGWNIALGWHGFSGTDASAAAAISPELHLELEKSLRTLLRRFVSPDWIDRRLAASLTADSATTSPAGFQPNSQA